MKTIFKILSIFFILAFSFVSWGAISINCAIQTFDGHYLTANNGGGSGAWDALQTNRTWIRAWERFTFVPSGVGGSAEYYAIKTVKGYYLSAVGGGGNAVVTSKKKVGSWEKFKLITLTHPYYALKTIKGKYLTATNGGGQVYYAIQATRTIVREWEMFRLADCYNL
jgi:hypothetical protein